MQAQTLFSSSGFTGCACVSVETAVTVWPCEYVAKKGCECIGS